MPTYLDYKRAGKLRYIGITTSVDEQYPGLIAAMNRYPFDFVQVDYSIDNRSAEQDVLPLALAKKHGGAHQHAARRPARDQSDRQERGQAAAALGRRDRRDQLGAVLPEIQSSRIRR